MIQSVGCQVDICLYKLLDKQKYLEIYENTLYINIYVQIYLWVLWERSAGCDTVVPSRSENISISFSSLSRIWKYFIYIMYMWIIKNMNIQIFCVWINIDIYEYMNVLKCRYIVREVWRKWHSGIVVYRESDNICISMHKIIYAYVDKYKYMNM